MRGGHGEAYLPIGAHSAGAKCQAAGANGHHAYGSGFPATIGKHAALLALQKKYTAPSVTPNAT